MEIISKKNTLWIYGCSHSMRFNPDVVTTSWPEIIASDIDFDLINRSSPGIGWNIIKDLIDEDFINWTKDDLIIISPSYFSRLSVLEMKDPFLRPTPKLWFDDLKEYSELARMTEDRWHNTIINLTHVGYNVWTWTWDRTIYTDTPNLIPPPQTEKKERSWEEWNKNTRQYWSKPYPHECGTGNWLDGDSHLSNAGHEFVAKHMQKYIKIQTKIY